MFKEIFLRDKKTNEEQLYLLRSLLDSIANPVFYRDVSGFYRGCNWAFAELLGLPFGKIIGKTVYDIFPKEQADIYYTKDQELFDTPGIQVYESKIRRGDGQRRDVIFHKATFYDAQGHAIGIMGSVMDITEQKKLQEELKNRAEEWGRTFNAISDGVFIIDRDNNIIQANESFADMFHAHPEDLVGQKCYRFVHHLENPWPDCPLELTKKDQQPHTEEVADPRLGVVLLVTTSPIFNDKRELIGAVHISKDITQQKNIENELRKKVQDLERFQKVTIDRELKMKELKTRIAELEKRSERP